MSGRDTSGRRFRKANREVEEDIEHTIGGETTRRLGGVATQSCAAMPKKCFHNHLFGGHH